MNVQHRFLRLQLALGEIEVFTGPPIDTAICLVVDPALTRAEWRSALEMLMRAFNEAKAPAWGGGAQKSPLERLAAKARTLVPLDPVTVQLISVDFSSDEELRTGVFRYICEHAAYGTSARMNLIIDTSRFPNGSGVQGMLGALSQWIANAPDPLPNRPPAPAKRPTIEQRVEALETQLAISTAQLAISTAPSSPAPTPQSPSLQ